ncbi:MAG: hypothetical protein NTZ94_14610, partial [Verrucomicrobia bacterium]|nr:hypothetical protein [Verrucomicrobiota bacterium]
AVVSAPSFRLHGRGRSLSEAQATNRRPSGPKIQAQRAVKPKSKISALVTSHLVTPEPRSA